LRTTHLTAALLVAILYALHQDFWFWRTPTPLVFGFLPIGLFYHAAYTLATSVVLWLLVRLIWPSDLDPEGDAAE
jgi:hypothetical protein